MKAKGLINKIKIVTLAGLAASVLSSCDFKPDEVFSGYAITVNNRIDANIEALEKLRSVGLVSYDMYTSVSNSMKSRLSDVNGDKLADDIKNAVNEARTEKITEYPKDGSDGTKHAKISAFNEIVGDLSKLTGGARAYEILPSTGNSDIQALNGVLKSEVLTLDLNKGDDLAEILSSIQYIKEKQDSATSQSDIEEMFKDQKYKESVNTLDRSIKGSGVSLMDGKDNLFRESEPQSINWNEDYKWEGDKDSGYELSPTPPSSGELNDPKDGKDLVVFCEDIPVVSIKLNEFNFEVVDELVNEVKGSKDYYLIYKAEDNKTAKILKLVYPLSYISSLTNDNGTVKINVEQSKYVSMNILTGQLILNEESNRLTAEERRNLESILNLNGVYDSGTDSNQSAIVAWDRASVKMKDHNGVERDYETSTVLLTDYLEYTYMPGLMTNGERFVSLGRKLKIVTKDSNIGADGVIKDPDNFAYFVDRKGKKIEGAGMISVSDFIDYRSGDSLYPDTKIKLSYGKPDGINTITVDDGVAAFGTGSSGKQIVPDEKATDDGGPNNWTQEQDGWHYTLTDGSKASNGWYLISNGAGIYHYFYFDVTGVMAHDSSHAGNKNKDMFKLDSNGYACDLNSGGIIVVKNNGSGGSSTSANTASIDDTNSIGNGYSNTALGIDSDTEGFTVTAFADTIYPITTFPLLDDANEVYVAHEDANYIGTSDSTEVFYGACIDKNIFSSQLYSGWINSEDSDIGNVEWWNNWLDTAKFNYHIDIEALKEYLGFNFAAELYDDESQTIILNPMTIAAIQNSVDSDFRVTIANFMRSIMIIFGYLAYAEAMLMLSAWAIDVFFSFGVKVMPLITFKKCEAVSSLDEYPNYNSEGIRYLDFKAVIIRAVALIAIGVILNSVDVLIILGNITNSVKMITDFVTGIMFNS